MQNKNKVLCVLLFSFPLFFIHPQNNDVERWWAEAIRLYEQTTNMQAAHTIMEVEELDARGRIRSSEILETRHEWVGNEERVIVLRNGIPIITRTTMEVSVSVLLIRRHFRMNTVYSQWTRKP